MPELRERLIEIVGKEGHPEQIWGGPFVMSASGPQAPMVETVVVDVIEQPAPGAVTVTEVEERRVG